MKTKKWKASKELIRLFQTVGRASLIYDIQDSHSGNMALLWTEKKGDKKIVITSTGSQKGDLEPNQICFLSASETDFGYYKASSETDIHARILTSKDVYASMHCHTKDLVIATLDDEKKPNKPAPFVPIDPLGYYFLGGLVPVDWFKVPSGSPEMIRTIPERLSNHPVTVVQAHGAFSRGRTLKEAFFLLCIANNSGYIVRLANKLGINVKGLRNKIQSDPDSFFTYPPAKYLIEEEKPCDFPEEEEITREFFKAGARIFESRLSPFHTGSLSIRGVKTMLYAPMASMPREIGGPLREIPLSLDKSDSPELQIHKKIYAKSNFQTVIHCYVPEAEALSYFTNPGETEPVDRIVPVDAEGSFLYLVIPVVPQKFDFDELVRLLHDYKVVTVRGGGIWGVGTQSISEVLHHPSSLREICLYRIGALEQGLDLKKMEPKKAKRW
ncbi:MAG: class II aldolase/adducin family protein [Candidatus Aminicenantes bacterium]|nr:class II aldolase/adducin family protein [Candidatus Aminicenantes bacterium]MBL7082273.1 class II aldolase/adducin family protein [Candidatus Aminicenantes bacterium]